MPSNPRLILALSKMTTICCRLVSQSELVIGKNKTKDFIYKLRNCKYYSFCESFFFGLFGYLCLLDRSAEDVKEVTLLSNYQMVILVYFKEFHLPAINSTFDRKVLGQKGGAEEKPQAIAFSLKKKTKVKLNWRLTTTKLMSHNQLFFFSFGKIIC